MLRTVWVRISFDIGHHSAPQNLPSISGTLPQVLLPPGTQTPFVGASVTSDYFTNRYQTGVDGSGQPIYRYDYLTITQSVSAISADLTFTPDNNAVPLVSYDLPFGPNGDPITIHNGQAWQWYQYTYDDAADDSGYVLPPSFEIPPIPPPPTEEDFGALFDGVRDAFGKGVDIADIIKEYGPQLIAAGSDAEQALNYLKKTLGLYGKLLDFGEALAAIRAADDPLKEFVLRVVDMLANAAVVGAGTTGGAAALSVFGPIGTVAGGIVGAVGSQIFFTRAASAEIADITTYWYDHFIGGAELPPGPAPTLDASVIVPFDPQWYVDTYPDVAADIGAGIAATPYDHYLGFGADRGHAPSAGTPNLPISEIVVPPNFDPRIGTPTSVVHGPIYVLPRDLASPAELNLVALINAHLDAGDQVQSDAELFAVANRIAENIVRSNTVSGLFGLVGELPPGLTLSNGISVKALFPDVDLVGARAFMVTGANLSPANVLTLVVEHVGGEAFLSDAESIGIAEFGGVWIILMTPEAGTAAAPQPETPLPLVLAGTALDDTLVAGARAATLIGGEGADHLVGGALADTLNGGLGVDAVNGDAGNDVIQYVIGDGADVLNGGAGVDTLAVTGDAGDSNLRVIYNGAQLTALAGAKLTSIETIRADMLGGTDWLIYSASTALSVNLTTGAASGFASIAGIENVVGGAGADAFTGNSGANHLEGGAGADTLRGGLGADTLLGGAGNDVFNYTLGDGADAVDGGADADTLAVAGTASDSTLLVTFNGSSLTKIMDMTVVSVETISANLLGGVDALVYESSAPIVVNLLAATASGFLNIAGIENVTGGSSGDTITGNASANRLDGAAGNDILNGATGADTLLGGQGDDTYYVDSVGDFTIEDINAGVDSVIASRSWAVSSNIERVILSGSGDFNVAGNGLANNLKGNSGDNWLNGSFGKDTLTGGGGRDSFIFNRTLGANNIDTVTDYDVVRDVLRIDNAVFGGIGAAGALAGGAFFAGTAAHDADDRIIYDQTTGKLFFDVDGLGGAAQIQFATLSNKPIGMGAGEFIII